jgi:hypothetical protein
VEKKQDLACCNVFYLGSIMLFFSLKSFLVLGKID